MEIINFKKKYESFQNYVSQFMLPLSIFAACLAIGFIFFSMAYSANTYESAGALAAVSFTGLVFSITGILILNGIQKNHKSLFYDSVLDIEDQGGKGLKVTVSNLHEAEE